MKKQLFLSLFFVCDHIIIVGTNGYDESNRQSRV